MDTRKFDDLTRSLAVGRSRRSMLKGLVGGAVGTIVVTNRPSYGVFAQNACSADSECADGEICCVGTCRAIQCCIDEVDPNARCPAGTSCFEGYCDPGLLGCESDDECAGDEICCGEVCVALQCCIDDTDPNARCPEGTTCFEGYCNTPCEIRGCDDGFCCCDDGTCSVVCCETPISNLPATGSGSVPDHTTWIAAAAIGGTAAWVTARTVRESE